MKTFLLVLSVLLFLNPKFKSQIYYPMVQDSMMDFQEYVDLSDPTTTRYWKIFRKWIGDTIINSNSYIKVYESGARYPDTTYIYNYARGDRYIGATREFNKQVFYIKKNDSIEYLMFDFNLNIGDTLKHHSQGDSSSLNLILARIDTVLVLPDSSLRKEYRYYDIPNNYSVLEGIGLLNKNSVLRSGADVLSCVQYKYKKIYGTNDSCSCGLQFYKSIFASIKETNFDKNLVCYPNPSQNFTKIKLPKNVNTVQSIILLDMNGVEINKFSSSTFKDSEIEIKLSNIPSGKYIVIINTESSLFYSKIIKN